MTRPPALTIAGLVAVTLTGCGITNPYQPPNPAQTSTSSPTTTSSTTPPAADAGDPAPERAGSIPNAAKAGQDKLAADASSPTPRAALRRYATLYINWQASDLIAHQRQLAAISLDQARAQALQAAASTAKDTELTTNQVTNHGQLVAITPGQNTATGDWVLVTRERTTGRGDYTGLPPALHVIYAHVTHTASGWVVNQWTPQT
jgi:hypothetical protein